MRYLWITSVTMAIAGVVLAILGLAVIQQPIAFVCGVLLLWSGVVKFVVLRLWRRSLVSSPARLTPADPGDTNHVLGPTA